MILTTHAVVGAAIGRLASQNPILAFFLGFASHFILDAIPHSQYDLKSFVGDKKIPATQDMILNKKFIRDIFVIGLDFFFGLFFCLFAFKERVSLFNPSLSVICGIFGGVLPDALQFCYFKIRKEPLASLQKFHIHVDRTMETTRWIGIVTQAAIVVAAVIISKIIMPL